MRSADFLTGFALFLDGFIVVPVKLFAFLKFEEVVDVGDDGGLIGDAENVRAEIEDLGGNVLIGAVDEADDGDDGGNADDHADKREDAAELVRPKAGGGDSYRLGKVHCRRPGHGRKEGQNRPHPNIRRGGGRNNMAGSGTIILACNKKRRALKRRPPEIEAVFLEH